jgi:hypothetical protein
MAVIVCLWSASTFAQADRRGFLHGDPEYGSMHDDEGSLGAGVAF